MCRIALILRRFCSRGAIARPATRRAVVALVAVTVMSGCASPSASPQGRQDFNGKAEDASFQAKVQYTTMCVLNPKLFLRTYFENAPRSTDGLIPSDALAEDYDVRVQETAVGDQVLTVSPVDAAALLHIVYLHGGGYVVGKSGFAQDESVVRQLVDVAQARVSYIDYPVAPEHHAKDAMVRLRAAYALAVEGSTVPVVLVGESAGGGLAVALAQQLRDAGEQVPTKLVLFSPWLDVGLSNPDIAALEPFDCFLDRETLQWSGQLWASALDVQNPIVSPLYGELTYLGEMLVFVSLHEIMLPDTIVLRDKAASADGVSVDLRRYAKMPHVWIRQDLPETEHTWDEVRKFLRTP